MFYSQFILAKKGPLGTIWIAAHLERKLRKNQVSDTDIGVSVDSILFPEMPIALRLSSHLLLGVVRIYSKKVSYLFDDCSEALLKVKNAFRANAVDLPPEESTAPYHAITLPETFDLDDFELPDNENLQGFVDHHVGAKEQITLQDTMEGVVYTTSEFGRDERFGDGEASHLDLNEELVMEKAATTAADADTDTLNSNVDLDPQASSQAKTPAEPAADTDTLNLNSVDPQASFQAKTPAETAADTDTATLNSNVDPQASFQAKTPEETAADIDTDTLNSNVDPQASFQAKTPAETAGVTDTATLNSNVDPQASFQANTPAETAADTDTATATATLNSNVDLDPQAKTPVKDDEDHDAMSDDDGLDQMDDSDGYDDGDADYVPDDYEGPSTPGLWEEPNLPNIQETPTCDDESLKEKLENTSQKLTDYVPHQQEKSTPVDHMSIDDFGDQSITMTQGLEGVKETYYENAIEKEHGNDINTRDNWFKVQGNIENAYHPTTSHLVSNSETLNEHENNPTNVSSFHSLETTREKENPSNFFGGSGLMQGEASHATNTFDLNLQEIHFTQSHDEDQVGCNLYNEQPYNVNQGDNINNTTNIYTSHFSSSERLLGVQERFQDIPQQDKTNVYTSHFQASERLPVVQERFQDVNQGINININTINPINTNIYTSPLLPVQERFSDHVTTQRDNPNSYTPHFPDTDRLLGVQEKFPQGDNDNINTSGYTSTFPTADTLLGVQERFPQTDNTNNYTSSQISAPDRLLGVQERFQDPTQGNKSNNTNVYPSSSSSSHFAPAERLLAVQERFSDAVLRQNTTTPVQENLSRGDGGHFTSGKKRSFNDSSMMSQSINFGDPSGLLTTKITPQSVPNNDDILSSILVGRSSVMQVNPTPPQKRRRQTAPKPPKSSVPPKRKVPMDDSTVLHGDMIRQQLTDTSDIRRPRKKVSCTWVELSMIHKQLWEDAIFHEALFTGMSIKLASLHSRSYDLRKIRVSRVESSSDAPPPPLQTVSQIDENVENAPEENLNLREGNTTNEYPSEEQMNATNEVREETATIETDAALQSVQSDEKSEKTDMPSVGMDASIDINSKYIDNKTDEIKIDIGSPEKTSEAKDEVEVVVVGPEVIASPEKTSEAKDEVEVVVVGPEVVAIDQEMEEIGKNENEEETPKPEVECNENNSVPEGTFGKQLEAADTENVTEVESCSKQVLLDNNDKQVSDHQDASPEETNIEEDNNPKNRLDDDEVEYSPVQNNTDFLNFDDEDDNNAEEPDEDLSDNEEKRLIDNSGWSSRTKAVGKYLQNMFNKEEENGRKALRMNSLLNGKTRKEASRMFFETLVLKTKDYIHVEQSDAFENIEILPRSKLLKSDF
ncbi:unnamed protein product [Lactuca virosa]|uniref:Sister chromatid cohesion 1 protein 4 n=1 Tax=Lactuca virosa TaxID=75947 RepID=A0AAU9P1L3_9ASTR|nr:unnamed protein product [Lactuca virosa]